MSNSKIRMNLNVNKVSICLSNQLGHRNEEGVGIGILMKIDAIKQNQSQKTPRNDKHRHQDGLRLAEVD